LEESTPDGGARGSWNETARLLGTMVHPVRLQILRALCEGCKCVKELNALISISQPHLSQHMTALRKAKLVACHPFGPLRCYYILRPTLVDKLFWLLGQDHPPLYRERDSVVREAQHAGAAERKVKRRGRKAATKV